jgi:hypothetical protein
MREYTVRGDGGQWTGETRKPAALTSLARELGILETTWKEPADVAEGGLDRAQCGRVIQQGRFVCVADGR